jgi:sodium transport system permease protein
MNPILQVFSKEMREIVRDKRVRTAATVMPIFLVALMMSLFGFIGKVVGGDAKRKVYVVASGNPLASELKKAKNLQIVEVPTEDAGVKLIQKGDARLLAVFAPPAGGIDHIRLRFDPKEDGAQLAKAAFVGALQPELQRRVTKLLRTVSIQPDQLQSITFDEKPVQVGEGKGSSGLIVSLLPYLLVLFTFTGGVALAADLVAGEKERSTLETLLIAPVGRTQIVLGKFFALAIVCIAGALSGLLGFALSALIPGTDFVFKSGLGLTLGGAGLVVLVLLPLAATFSGVFIALSTFARNTREAQTYLGVLNLLVIIPAVFSQLIGMTEIGNAVWLPFVPILGAAAGVRAILLGKATALSILGPLGVGILLAGLALYAAVRLFHRESVLLRV